MTVARIEAAVAALGEGPLTEASVQQHVAPLFSRVLAQWRDRIYLANHSLGRPLDATEDDVREGLSAWYAHMGGAWDAWFDEMRAFRERLAGLMGAGRPDCVVPKTSAGQGLRAILNTYDVVPHVVATRGEFDSLDVILREYARRGRIALTLVEPDDLAAACDAPVDLVVVSHVMFGTGRCVTDLDDIVARTHRAGGRVLLDLYHSLGVLPVDVRALDVDFAVGGSYKYLRGGPGACYLYLAPRHLDGRLRTLDIGWFAKRDPFTYRRPDPPRARRRRRRVSRIDPAGAHALPGACGPGVHAAPSVFRACVRSRSTASAVSWRRSPNGVSKRSAAPRTVGRS